MNNLKKTAVTLTLGLGGLITAGAASAETLLDFTSATQFVNPGATFPFTLATPQTVGNATVTSSSGELKFYSPFEGPLGTGLAGNYDGVGITDDEQRGSDVLTVTYDNLRKVTLIQVLDLFQSSKGTETVDIKFFDGSLTEIAATQLTGAGSGAGGYVAQAFNLSGVKQIVFTTETIFGDDGTNDVAVAGITTVPIPAAAWLFGSALVGMVGMGRRKLKKA